MKIIAKRILVVSLPAWALLVQVAQADLLVSDNFSGSSGTNVSAINNTEVSGVGHYSTVQGTAGMTITNLSGFGDGNSLALANGTQTYYRPFDDGATLTLNGLTAGQKLSLSYTARFDGSFSGDDNFCFGFVSSNPANSILYTTLDMNGGAPVNLISEFRYRTGSFNMSDAGAAFGSIFTNTTTASATSYTLELSVTRQVNNAFLIEYCRDGVLYGATTEANGGTFANTAGGLAISGIAFRNSQVPGVITYIDNVSVSLIPEPFTGLLFLGGGLMLAATRRTSNRQK